MRTAALDGWVTQARCAQPDVNPDWWSSGTDTDRSLASHICRRHCPALQPCREEALDVKPHGVVQGGLYWLDTILPKNRRPSGWQSVARWCFLCVARKPVPRGR